MLELSPGVLFHCLRSEEGWAGERKYQKDHCQLLLLLPQTVDRRKDRERQKKDTTVQTATMRRDKSNLLPDKWSPQQHRRAAQIRQAFAFFGQSGSERVRLQFVPLYHFVLVKINDDANLAPFEGTTVVAVALLAKQRQKK